MIIDLLNPFICKYNNNEKKILPLLGHGSVGSVAVWMHYRPRPQNTLFPSVFGDKSLNIVVVVRNLAPRPAAPLRGAEIDPAADTGLEKMQ